MAKVLRFNGSKQYYGSIILSEFHLIPVPRRPKLLPLQGMFEYTNLRLSSLSPRSPMFCAKFQWFQYLCLYLELHRGFALHPFIYWRWLHAIPLFKAPFSSLHTTMVLNADSSIALAKAQSQYTQFHWENHWAINQQERIPGALLWLNPLQNCSICGSIARSFESGFLSASTQQA